MKLLLLKHIKDEDGSFKQYTNSMFQFQSAEPGLPLVLVLLLIYLCACMNM